MTILSSRTNNSSEKYISTIIDFIRQKKIDPVLIAYIGLNKYLMEHRTAGIILGRRTGKSTYILNHIQNDDLMIVPNYQAIKSLNVFSVNGGIYSIQHGRIIFTVATADVLRPSKGHIGKIHNTVWIEDPSIIFSIVKKEDLYQAVGSSSQQVFVMLGI